MVHCVKVQKALQGPIAVSTHVHCSSSYFTRKVGTTRSWYTTTSPTILSSHSLRHGVDRDLRFWQLEQSKLRAIDGDEVEFPKSYLFPDDDDRNLKFEALLNLKLADDRPGKGPGKRSSQYRLQARQDEEVHERACQVYLSLYEFEHRILDAMNLRRGLTPRERNPGQVKCRHTTWDD